MTKPQAPEFSTPTSFVTYRLARVQSCLNAQGTALLKQHAGLSLVEWRIIQLLRIHENATQTEIANRVQIDKGQLSRKITAMIDAGLLKYTVNQQDQRARHLKVTQSAQTISDRVMPLMKARQDRLLADVSPEDLETFYRVLDKIHEAAKYREG